MTMYSLDFVYRGISARHSYVISEENPEHLTLDSPEILARKRSIDDMLEGKGKWTPNPETKKRRDEAFRLYTEADNKRRAVKASQLSEIMGCLKIDNLPEYETIIDKGNAGLRRGRKCNFTVKDFITATTNGGFELLGYAWLEETKTFKFFSWFKKNENWHKSLVDMTINADFPDTMIVYMNESIVVPNDFFKDPEVISWFTEIYHANNEILPKEKEEPTKSEKSIWKLENTTDDEILSNIKQGYFAYPISWNSAESYLKDKPHLQVAVIQNCSPMILEYGSWMCGDAHKIAIENLYIVNRIDLYSSKFKDKQQLLYEFYRDKWHNDVKFLSDPNAIVSNKYAKHIISQKEFLPFILNDLADPSILVFLVFAMYPEIVFNFSPGNIDEMCQSVLSHFK